MLGNNKWMNHKPSLSDVWLSRANRIVYRNISNLLFVGEKKTKKYYEHFGDMRQRQSIVLYAIHTFIFTYLYARFGDECVPAMQFLEEHRSFTLCGFTLETKNDVWWMISSICFALYAYCLSKDFVRLFALDLRLFSAVPYTREVYIWPQRKITADPSEIDEQNKWAMVPCLFASVSINARTFEDSLTNSTENSQRKYTINISSH